MNSENNKRVWVVRVYRSFGDNRLIDREIYFPIDQCNTAIEFTKTFNNQKDRPDDIIAVDPIIGVINEVHPE